MYTKTFILLISISISVGQSIFMAEYDSQMFSIVNHFNKEFFHYKTTSISIVMEINKSESKYYFNDLISKLLSSLGDVKVNLRTTLDDDGDDDWNNFEYYTIVMVDSYDAFRKIDPGEKSQSQDFSEYYLVIFYANVTLNYTQEMQQIFDYCWSYYIVNVDIIMEVLSDNISLYTYYPFSANHCHKVVAELMSFGENIKNLKSTELYPEKANNFHNCKLMTSLWDVPPYMMIQEDPVNGQTYFNGIEGYLLNVLAMALNFSIDYKIPPNNELRGTILKNGTRTGAIKILEMKEANLSLGCFRRTLDRSTILTPSVPYYQTDEVFAVLSASVPWTTYEIIAYPFDFSVWCAVIGLLILLSFSTVVLQHVQVKFLEFIYGSADYTSVIMHLVVITLGQSSRIFPVRNFSRFSLTMLVLLTLVLRSAYQGLLYSFFSSQKAIPPPKTANELIQRNYKMITNWATIYAISDVPIIREKQIEITVLNITEPECYPIIEQHKFERYVVGAGRDFFIHYVNSNAKYDVFHVLEETIYSLQIGIYFPKHSFMLEPVNKIVLNLCSLGLIDHWSSKYLDTTFLEQKVHYAKQTSEISLTMKQLYGIFQIQYCCWIVPVFVFVGELIWFRLVSRHNIIAKSDE